MNHSDNIKSRLNQHPENCFLVCYLDTSFNFCRQTAVQELEIAALARAMLPLTADPDVSTTEQLALAYNAVLLYQTLEDEEALERPDDALYRFSVGQIGDLCALYQRGLDGKYTHEGGVRCSIYP